VLGVVASVLVGAGGGCASGAASRGTVCSAMRGMCGAGADSLAISYQYLCGVARESV
jgi:hypothetical protein